MASAELNIDINIEPLEQFALALGSDDAVRVLINHTLIDMTGEQAEEMGRALLHAGSAVHSLMWIKSDIEEQQDQGGK